LHIDSPDKVHDLAPEAHQDLEGLYTDADMEPIHTVSEWIFPAVLYQRGGIELLFEEYPEIESELSDNWGTYFGRMIKRENPETGEEFNPLKKLIEKMERSIDPNKQTYHSCYEVNFSEAGFDLPLYRDSDDRKQYRGLPCLSHISFNLFDGEVQLTALYRSHDYRFKVPGNLLGLARLQACIANEIDAEVGELVVHSTRAFVNQSAGIPDFRELIKTIDSEIDSGEYLQDDSSSSDQPSVLQDWQN
jgi:thymidylate synthase